MAPDDRDHTFEKALARHLRPDSTGDMTDDADAAHPGAEVLAAYHERLLAPEQMILWKGHIASCERCQQILAHLEATDEIMIEDTREEPRSQNVLPMLAAELAEPEHAPVPAASPARAADRWSRRFKMRSGANWRWLAPAGALAAGLLLWISFHEANAPSFQLARNQKMTTPAAGPAALPEAPPPAKKEAASTSTYATDAVTRPSTEPRSRVSRESEALRRDESALLDEKRSTARKADKPAAPSQKPSPPLSSVEADHGARSANVIAGAVNGGGGKAGDVTDEEMQLQKQAPASVSASNEFKNQRTDNLDGAANQLKSETLAKAKTASAAAAGQQASQTVAVESATQQPMPTGKDVTKLSAAQAQTERVANVRHMNASMAATIPAPGGAVLWSAGQAGIIRHSTDAGATWTVQTSGVVADLLAGSSPSDQVCWIVGRSGTILRTTDGGAHWQKIRAPVTDDFLAVFAVDAQQASISLAQATYQTKDGGKTWTKLLPE